jgi:hypothetical protein
VSSDIENNLHKEPKIVQGVYALIEVLQHYDFEILYTHEGSWMEDPAEMRIKSGEHEFWVGIIKGEICINGFSLNECLKDGLRLDGFTL